MENDLKENNSKSNEEIEPKKLEFEKYKLRIQLFKWIIGTLGISIVTLIIDFGFRDRAASVVEMQLYDRYVTDLIVLNSKTGPRRLLAQYFANVTASEKLKKGWIDYYNVVNEEYQIILQKDSLVSERIDELMKDTLNRKNASEISTLKKQREIYKQEINTEVLLVKPKMDFNGIIEAENYYRSGSPQGKEQALKIYYSISQGLSEYQKLALSENMRRMLLEADEAYKNNFIEDALAKYYLVFKSTI